MGEQQSPKPVASHLPKLLPVLLSSTISIVVFMQVTGIHTRCLLLCLTQSSKNIMVSLLIPSIPVIWMSARFRETLMLLLLCTPLVSGLAGLSMDLDYLRELPRIKELELRTSWRRLLPTSLEILLVLTSL